MSPLAHWAVEGLVASTLLMIAVLGLRGLVRRAFGAQVAYALWALPVLRLLLPPLPASVQAAATPLSRAGDTITILVVAPTHAVASAAIPSVFPLLGLVTVMLWAAGAAAFLAWHLVRHVLFCKRILANAEPLDAHGDIRVVASTRAPGPLAFGLWRRYVAFPRDFDARYDADERDLALAHEIGHHQRGDLFANWIALVVFALHWFNPVAWRAFHAFRADQELANDARVLAGRSATDRHIYACAIVKAAHGGAVSAACHLHTVTDLKGRLRMLTTSRTSRRRIATGAAAVAILVSAGLGLTASGTRAASNVTDGIETATGLTLKTPATPNVPTVDGTTTDSRRLAIVKDGKTMVYDGRDADRYIAAHPTPVPAVPPMPRMATMDTMPSMPRAGAVPTVPAISAPPAPVQSANCGPDRGQKAYTMTRREGQAIVTVICTDRIDAAAHAETLTGADQAAIQRQAMTGALASLHATRAKMLANTMIPGKDRAEALSEIDSAIKELQGEIADIGKD